VICCLNLFKITIVKVSNEYISILNNIFIKDLLYCNINNIIFSPDLFLLI
jgi:hypothetical protein